MILALVASAVAAPDAGAFAKDLTAAIKADDRVWLRAFFFEDLAGATDEDANGYLDGGKGVMARWADAGLWLRCLGPLCQLEAGGRPVMFVKVAPEGHPTAYVAHSERRQLTQFYEKYSLRVQTDDHVRVRVNGEPTLLIDDVNATTVEVRVLNDWLVVGDNTITLEPVGSSARVALAVGGHARFTPSPDVARANRVAFSGTLDEPRTFTFTAPAARPVGPAAPWPTDLRGHVRQGLATWLGGGDEYSFLPWHSWLDDEVRAKLQQTRGATLEPLFVVVDLTLGDRWHLSGQYQPDPVTPRWFHVTLEERVGARERAPEGGPYAVFDDEVARLVDELRAPGCPAAEHQLEAATIIEWTRAGEMAAKIEASRAASAKELVRACEAIAALPADAKVTWLFDDVTIAVRDHTGATVALVNGEFSFRDGWSPFIFSMIKPPRPTH